MDTHPAKRTSVALLLVLTLALGVLGAAQDPSLRLVSTVWPPFTDVDGKPRLALDLVEAATSRIGLTTRTTMVDAPGFTPALISGPFDGSAAAWRDSERERALLFSEPYLENRLILVGRQGSDVSAASLSALKGKRVAIVGGYAYGDGIDTVGPTFFRTNSEVDSLRELLDGQVDYALIDELVVTSIANAYPEQARTRLHVGTASMLTRQLFFAIRRTVPGAASIIERFNAQLIAMVADRTYHRLLHVPWITADVDGDGLQEIVPESDRVGAAEPTSPYVLISQTKPMPELKKGQQRFYLGGTIYESWAAVPTPYKTNNQEPDSRRSTGSVFTIGW